MPLGQFVAQSGTAQVFKKAHIPMLRGQEVKSGVDSESPHTFPFHKGGGWYVLSDGSEIQGKEKAFDAQANLNG